MIVDEISVAEIKSVAAKNRHARLMEESIFYRAIKTKCEVKIIMINGFQMTGVIEDVFNNWVIFRTHDTRKHVNANLISAIEEMPITLELRREKDDEG